MSIGRAADGSERARLVERALLLSVVSVLWGALSGGFSVTVGVVDGSLAVVGVGLGVLADLAGSAALVRRFRAERLLVAGATHALLVGSRPDASLLSVVDPVVTAPCSSRSPRPSAAWAPPSTAPLCVATPP